MNERLLQFSLLLGWNSRLTNSPFDISLMEQHVTDDGCSPLSSGSSFCGIINKTEPIMAPTVHIPSLHGFVGKCVGSVFCFEEGRKHLLRNITDLHVAWASTRTGGSCLFTLSLNGSMCMCESAWASCWIHCSCMISGGAYYWVLEEVVWIDSWEEVVAQTTAC